jgi:hypothetical protein
VEIYFEVDLSQLCMLYVHVVQYYCLGLGVGYGLIYSVGMLCIRIMVVIWIRHMTSYDLNRKKGSSQTS